MQRLIYFSVLLLLLAPAPSRADTHALRGLVANDPPTVNVFHPEWTESAFGLYLNQYNFGDTKIAIGLFEQYSPLTAQNIAAIVTHPNYDGWWILLREPDLNQTPIAAATEANAEEALVLSVDPNARFCLSVGTGVNPPYLDNSYAEQLYALIDNHAAIRAFCATYYPYLPQPHLRVFAKRFNAWHPNKGHWIQEMGIVKGQPPTQTIAAAQNGLPPIPFTLTNARAELDAQGIDRGAWFAQLDSPGTVAAGYEDLEDVHYQLTTTGDEFLAP